MEIITLFFNYYSFICCQLCSDVSQSSAAEKDTTDAPERSDGLSFFFCWLLRLDDDIVE